MAFLNKVGNILKPSSSKQISSQFSASNPFIYQALRCMSSSQIFVGARVVLNKSKGFGFVTFSSPEAASSAIQAMNGQDLQGRKVNVNYATERKVDNSSSGCGGCSGGYDGGNSNSNAGGNSDSSNAGGNSDSNAGGNSDSNAGGCGSGDASHEVGDSFYGGGDSFYGGDC